VYAEKSVAEGVLLKCPDGVGFDISENSRMIFLSIAGDACQAVK